MTPMLCTPFSMSVISLRIHQLQNDAARDDDDDDDDDIGRTMQLQDLVDDDEAVRHTLSLILTPAGYQVTGFSDGFAFINDKNLKPDCVVLDLSMPGLSGIDLLRGRPHQVCKIFKTAHPPLQRPRIRIIMVRLQV